MSKKGWKKEQQKPDLHSSLLEFRRKADAGDVDAQFNLGLAYSGKAVGVTMNIEASLKWLRLAASNGHADARLLLGELLILNKNLRGEAIAWLQQLVDEGNPKAMNNLASAYAHGVGVPKDLVVAEKLFKEALKCGINEALVGLAAVYSMDGPQQNFEESFKLNQQAVAAGQAGGWYNLSLIYKVGCGSIKQDATEAFACMKRAAEGGYIIAMSELGRFYHVGYGVTRDLQAARNWYEQGAKVGSTECVCLLAQLYFFGQGVDRNLSKGMVLFNRAAAEGDVIGRLMMAMSTEYGLGVTVDSAVTLHRYECIANEDNNPSAMYALGMAYENGWLGVAVEPTVAVEWFTRAAQLGHVAAATALRYPHGPLHIDLKRLSIDQKIAFARARLGDASSESYVGVSIYNAGANVENPLDYYAEALRWLNSAAEKNESTALPYIQFCLEKLGSTAAEDWSGLYQKLLVPAQEGDQSAIKSIISVHHNWLRQPFRNPAFEVIKWHEKLLAQSDSPERYNELANIYFNLAKHGRYAVPIKYFNQMPILKRGFFELWMILCRKVFMRRQRHKYFKMSHALYEKSAAHNNKDAITSLGDLALCGHGEHKDAVKAFQYYQKSAKLGDRAANIYIGVMLYLGIGCEKDEATGKAMLIKRAKAGDSAVIHVCNTMKLAPAHDLPYSPPLYKQTMVFDGLTALHYFLVPMIKAGAAQERKQKMAN